MSCNGNCKCKKTTAEEQIDTLERIIQTLIDQNRVLQARLEDYDDYFKLIANDTEHFYNR